MNLSLMLHGEYWLALRPLAMTGKTAVMLSAFFALMLVLGVVFRNVYRKLKKSDRFMSYTWRRAANMSTTMGLFGLVMTFFRYQGAPLFGMRLWYIVWLLATLIWTGTILWYRFKQLPGILAANHEVAIK